MRAVEEISPIAHSFSMRLRSAKEIRFPVDIAQFLPEACAHEDYESDDELETVADSTSGQPSMSTEGLSPLSTPPSSPPASPRIFSISLADFGQHPAVCLI